jgi:hypothetical protein
MRLPVLIIVPLPCNYSGVRVSLVLTQQEAAAHVVGRSDLLSKLANITSYRTYRVRKTVGSLLDDDEVKTSLHTALGTGFFRALLVRFCEDHGLTKEWWIAARNKYERHGKDRTHDLEIILKERPDFRDYVVDLSDAELLDAAKLEYRDSIAAIGTDYHQMESQRQNADNYGEVLMLKRPRDLAEMSPVAFHNPTQTILLDATEGEVDFVDPTAQDRVENVLVHRLMDDENNPLGPIVTQVAVLALREYGPGGLFWLVETLFLPKRYTDVLRVMAGTEEELGAKEFDRVRRDMVRKLPDIHTRMLSIIRTDPAFTALVEMIDASRTLPLRAPKAPVSRPLQSVVAQERARFAKRHWPRLKARLSSRPDLVGYFEALPEPEQMAVLHSFVRVEDEEQWTKFVFWMVKNMGDANHLTACA